MKVAVCDDCIEEALQIKIKIENYMPESCMLSEVDVFTSGEELLNCEKFYDLIFIDCNLPDMDGVEVAKMIREHNNVSSIIFVTAFIDYATEGYKVDALRYLMKPVRNEKMAEALVAYENHIRLDSPVEITGLHTPIYVKTDEIMYIESLGKRTIVRLSDRTVESAKSLEQFESEIICDTMIRTCRQFIVNMKYISRKEKDTIVMANGEIVVVSRRKINEFNKIYMNYLKYCE